MKRELPRRFTYLPGKPTITIIVGTWLDDDAFDFPELDAPLLL